MSDAILAPDDLRVRLSGRHVVVEPLAAEHEPGLVAAATDPEMFTWMMGLDMSAPEVMHRVLGEALDAAAAGREVPFVVLDAPTGEVIGATRFLSLALEHLVAEIGFTWVTRARWGGGANVETKLLLLSHAFETVGLRRVEFKTDARNERSRGALAALGAQFEGIFRKHRVLPGGGVRDSAYYAVIDDDWPGVRRGLERRLAALPEVAP